MEIPVAIDMIQSFGEVCTVPEIRVWCHPHKTGKYGADDYRVFDSFAEALKFIGSTPEAESAPLIAYNGYEINIFELAPPEAEKVEDADVNVRTRPVLDKVSMGVGGNDEDK